LVLTAQAEGIRKRITSVKWWARRLRIKQGQEQELQAIRLGLVNAKRQAYISDFGLMSVLTRQEMGAQWLAAVDLITPTQAKSCPSSKRLTRAYPTQSTAAMK
jgi:hypothetical protein